MERFWVVSIAPADYDTGPEIDLEPFWTMEAAINHIAKSVDCVGREIIRGEYLEETVWWEAMWQRRKEIAVANMKQTNANIEEQERAELARLQAKYGATP